MAKVLQILNAFLNEYHKNDEWNPKSKIHIFRQFMISKALIQDICRIKYLPLCKI